MLDQWKKSGIKMRIKAVLFDFGGTLVETPPQFDYETCLLSHHQSLIKNGVSVSYEDYKKTEIETWKKFFAVGSLREVTFPFVISEVLTRLGYSLKPTGKIVTEAAEAFMKPLIKARTMDEHVPSILRRLKKKYKLGVVSNSSYSPTVRKTLERFRLDKFFDAVVVSADVGWRKPSPKIFRKALQALRIATSESVFIGDEPEHDVEGAKKVGMRTILLKKPSTNEKMHKVKPDETIYEIKDLPRALASLEAGNLTE